MIEYPYTRLEPSNHHKIILPIIFKQLNTLALEGKILDVGCGNGAILEEIRKRGSWNLFGVDSSISGTTLARSRGLNIHRADCITQLVEIYGHQCIDLITAIELIEHLYDPRGFLDEAYQCLKPQGKILLSTPYHGYLKNLSIALLNKTDSHYNPLWDGGHIKFWSWKTLKKILENTGFVNIRFYGTGRIYYFWKSMVITANKE